MSLTLPNLLSATRIGLIPLFIIAVLDGQPARALVVFTVAGVTDLLDGLIARFYDQQSVLGAYLDPMADKLLLTSAYILLAIPGLLPGHTIPVWVTVLVITRDVSILVVALAVHLTLGIRRFPPSMLSKWNTAFQILAVFAVLLSGLSERLEPVALVTVLVVAALTIASGLEYSYRFIYRAHELPRVPRAVAEPPVAVADRPRETP